MNIYGFSDDSIIHNSFANLYLGKNLLKYHAELKSVQIACRVIRNVFQYWLNFGRKYFLEVSYRAHESSKTKIDDTDYTKNVVIHDLQCERLNWTDFKILKFPFFLRFNLLKFDEYFLCEWLKPVYVLGMQVARGEVHTEFRWSNFS